MSNRLPSFKMLCLLFSIVASLQLTACTSQDEKSEDALAEDVESIESDTGTAQTAETQKSETLPEDSLGTPNDSSLSLDAPTATPDTTANNDLNLEPAPPPAENLSATTEPTMSEKLPAETSTVTETMPAPVPEEEKMIADTSSSEAAPIAEEKPKPAPAPLQKMATQPWKVGDTWYNAIYFARPGDSLSSISQMIYNEDRVSMLKKGNPSYKNRQPKPGDKVYYNSPTRPMDSERILTYYEDMGVKPEVYVAKPGDNIRKISKELLGYDGAWKEVWSSNLAVESKSELSEGTELQYWKNVPAAQNMASTNAETSNQMPPMETAPPVADMPPPPPAEPAMDLPPPPDAMTTASNDFPPPPAEPAMDLPPPPPPMEAAPPPPPPPPAQASNAGLEEESSTGLDQDTMMSLGAIAIAAAGVALLLVRRRARQKEAESALSDSTHVG